MSAKLPLSRDLSTIASRIIMMYCVDYAGHHRSRFFSQESHLSEQTISVSAMGYCRTGKVQKSYPQLSERFCAMSAGL